MISRLSRPPPLRKPVTPPAVEQPARNAPRTTTSRPAVDSFEGPARAASARPAVASPEGPARAASARPAVASLEGLTRAASGRLAVDSFEGLARAASVRPAIAGLEGLARAASATRAQQNTDGLKTYGELSPGQRALLGPQGEETYGRLSGDQRGAFLLLSQRMERTGADFSGLQLKDPETTLRRNRMLFDDNPEGLERLRTSLEAGVERGTFTESPVFEPFHKGMSDWGVRENRQKWSMQLGMGPEGAFVDVDHYNPNSGIFGKIGHVGEIIVPGKPDPRTIAAELGEDLSTRLPAEETQPLAA